jgi:hypothetical protein
MAGVPTKQLQSKLNAFTNKYLAYITPLRVDGERGHATNKQVNRVKWYLGYPADERDHTAGEELLWRMKHPNKRHKEWAPYRRIVTGMHRRSKQRRVATKNHRAMQALARQHDGFGSFDGKTVAAWMVPILQKSRSTGWLGTVVSGVRTPDYSEHLCYAMCGRPFCSGRCAGRSSNHNMLASQGKPHGALDVSDYARFGRIQHQIGSPLVNHLGARDPVHFSVSGQ